MASTTASECLNCGWRPADPPWLWPSHGGIAVRWIEDNLVFPEGDTQGEPFRLRPDQKLFMWKWYEYCPDCGYWRYSEGVRGAATGDGKSTFIAAISLLEFAGPPEIAPVSPNIVVAAASWDQADELFRKAGQMVGGKGDDIHEAPLCGFFNVMDSKITFKGGSTGVLERVAAVAGTNEGGLPTLFVCDELHEWGDVGSNKARIYTVIGKSTRKRRTRHGPGRVLNLSTAGFDKDHSLLGTIYMNGKAVLANPELDPKLLFDWQESDESLDLEDPEQRAIAVKQASKAAGILWDVRDRVADWGKPMFPKHEWIRYYANRWVDIAEDSWLVDYPAAWGKCQGTWEHDPLNPFVLSVDMALKHDHVAVARLEELPHPGHAFVNGRCTVPGCRQLGKIAVTVKHWHANDGGQIDHLEVWGYIDENARGKNFRGVVYDPRFFELPARVLEQKNVLTIQFDQSPQRMAPAAGLTRRMIVDREIVQDGDQELESAVKSAASVPQERGGFTLKKGKSLRHIDAAVAMCMGVYALREIIPMPPPATMDITKTAPGDFFRPTSRLQL